MSNKFKIKIKQYSTAAAKIQKKSKYFSYEIDFIKIEYYSGEENIINLSQKDDVAASVFLKNNIYFEKSLKKTNSVSVS